jgi:7,8-dihydropterin-6-yl-methyl-4-(beta-D-ribofuranosyl)aminobenzene 5'-phosphate synthase
MTKTVKIKEIDSLEIISLVDNSVDFLSANAHKQVKPFGQWAKERHGQEWLSTHNQFPLAEHGFSMLLRVFDEEKSECVLFDTGSSPEAIVENAKRMGIDLSEVGCVVLSHGHYDHFGGLKSVVKAIGKTSLPIIVHEDMFRTRGTAYSDGTTRKYTGFPMEAELSPAHVLRTKQPSLVADGMVCVTGEIPRETSFERGLDRHSFYVDGAWQPDPLILDDRAIVVQVKGQGLVIISGCAHAGIINTISYAQHITEVEKVYAVFGGFHLAGKAFEERIAPSVKEIARLKPKLIVPSHCTGWRAMFAIAEELPEAFAWNSVGNLYTI